MTGEIRRGMVLNRVGFLVCWADTLHSEPSGGRGCRRIGEGEGEGRGGKERRKGEEERRGEQRRGGDLRG